MHYLKPKVLRENPEIYFDIEDNHGWIYKEDFLYQYFEKLPRESKIVDVGCGNGYFLDWLRKKGFTNIVGIDINNYLKDKSHQHYAIDLNSEDLPFGDESIDCIVGFAFLEHVENYFKIRHEAERVLRKGGLFIFSIPNHFSLSSKINYLLHGNIDGFGRKNNHILFLTKNVFNKTFLNDFTLERIEYNRGGPIPGLGRITKLFGKKITKDEARLLPRNELFSSRVCYFLQKK